MVLCRSRNVPRSALAKPAVRKSSFTSPFPKVGISSLYMSCNAEASGTGAFPEAVEQTRLSRAPASAPRRGIHLKWIPPPFFFERSGRGLEAPRGRGRSPRGKKVAPGLHWMGTGTLILAHFAISSRARGSGLLSHPPGMEMQVPCACLQWWENAPKLPRLTSYASTRMPSAASHGWRENPRRMCRSTSVLADGVP